MYIGISDIWEGRTFNTEVCVMDNTRAIVETISFKKVVYELKDILLERLQILELLFIKYPNSTILTEHNTPIERVIKHHKYIAEHEN